MSAQRLADNRSTITFLAEAVTVFDGMALLKIEAAYQRARLERRIARLKAEFDEAMLDDLCAIADAEKNLAAFILSNKAKFEDPRKVKTTMGTFGLQKVNEVVIQDEVLLLQDIMEKGYDDCERVVRSPVKSAIAERLAAGEVLQGAQLKTGDTAVCTVAKTLLDEARNRAEE